VAELSRLARTVRAWEAEILAWHATDGCSNGPTEAVNLLINKVKRVGHGFRNFTNYRLRLLLYCGVRWPSHRTARLRGRFPRFGAEPEKASPPPPVPATATASSHGLEGAATCCPAFDQHAGPSQESSRTETGCSRQLLDETTLLAIFPVRTSDLQSTQNYHQPAQLAMQMMPNGQRSPRPCNT
jgi:hypothetical protein